MSTHRKLAKSAGTIGLFTGVSRVLGFIRDLIIAQAFGTGVSAEAFVVSFKIPNLLRDLVGEGAANAAIVPVLTESREKKRDSFWQLASTLFTLMAAFLAVVSVLGVVFAPVIVSLIAPGFHAAADPDKYPLTVRLTRVMFPYIFLIGLSALAMGVLNSLKEFKSSALGPCLLNLSMIVSGLFFERTYGPMALVVAVLIGGVLQLAVQVPPLIKSGFRFERPNFRMAGVSKIGKLLIPRAFGSALYQINIFVDSILASFESIIGPGGQSALYYANRLFQLPLAIFGLALAQAVLPTFSSQAVEKDLSGMRSTLSVAIRSLAFFMLPASAGLVVLCEPIVRVLFQHGHFDAASTAITSTALFYYAYGLFFCAVIKIFVNVFYAMQDTRTPLKITGIAVAVNFVTSVLLMRTLGLGGITLGSTLSATVNAFVLYSILKKRIGRLDEERIARSFMKMFAASLLMAGAAYFYNIEVLRPLMAASRAAQTLCLFGGILLCVALYAVLCRAFRVDEMNKIFRKRSA